MDLLLRIDLVGPRPLIKIEGNQRYSTFVGVFLTLTIVGVTLFTIRDIITNWYNQTNPVITTRYDQNYLSDNFTTFSFEEQINSFPQNMNNQIYLNSNQTNVYFSLISVNPITLQSSVIPREAIPDLYIYQLSPYFFQNAQYLDLSSLNKTRLESCLNHPEVTGISNSLKNKYFCIPLNTTNPIYHFKDGNIQAPILTIPYSKQLSSFLQPLSSVAMIAYLHQTIIDVTNPQKPYFKRYSQYIFPISKSSMTVNYVNMQYNKIESYTSSLLYQNEDNFQTTGVSDYGVKYSVEIPNNSLIDGVPLLSILFDYNDITKVTSIKYVGLDQVISQLGGTFLVYLIIGQALSFLLTINQFESHVINNIFKFHKYINGNERYSFGIGAINNVSKKSKLMDLEQEIKQLDNLDDNEDVKQVIERSVINSPHAKKDKKLKFDSPYKPSVNVNQFDEFMMRSDSVYVIKNHRNTEVSIENIRDKRSIYRKSPEKKSVFIAGKIISTCDLNSNKSEQKRNESEEMVKAINYLRDDIEKHKNERRNVYISPFDIFTAKIKFFLSKKLSIKEKMLILSTDHIYRTMDYVSLLKSSFDTNLIKQILFENKYRNCIQMPSFNIENADSIYNLENYASHGSIRNHDWTNLKLFDDLKKESNITNRKFLKLLKIIGLSNK